MGFAGFFDYFILSHKFDHLLKGSQGERALFAGGEILYQDAARSHLIGSAD